ncbi:MAG: carboxymuconolactone decarboxylase family protein [Chloroflexi bacterium]|nr:carboxymuconolactone decarboxylase family protein [Chloroflexota bacterium]
MPARIPQILDKAQLPPDYQPVFERVAASRGRPGGPYSILFHNPPVADKVDALSQTLRTDSGLTPADFTLTALAVARAKDCLFVWSVQAPGARRAGVSDEVINAVGQRQTKGLSEDQADIVAYARQVAASNRVDQAVFDRLRERHGVPWLVGLTTVAGHFNLICGVNNAFEVPPSPEGDALPG